MVSLERLTYKCVAKPPGWVKAARQLSNTENLVEKVNPIELSADDGCNDYSDCGDNAGIRSGRPVEVTIMRRLAAIAYLTMAFGFTGCTGRWVWMPGGGGCSPDALSVVPATPETPPPQPAAPQPPAECPSPAEKTEAKQVPLETALKNLDTRLSRLEELVLLHQQKLNAIKIQNP